MIQPLILAMLGLVPQAGLPNQASAGWSSSLPPTPTPLALIAGQAASQEQARKSTQPSSALGPADIGAAEASDQGNSQSNSAGQPGLGLQQGPLIGSLKVDLHGNGRATISWDTDVYCSSLLQFGTTSTNYQTLQTGGLSKHHSFYLDALESNKDYIYSAISMTARGEIRVARKQRFNSGGQVSGGQDVEVSGRLVKWFPVTLSFQGPTASELDISPNPFLDYRLSVRLTSPGGNPLTVPGYFDGDGKGGASGNIWRVRFPTHQEGRWSYTASFVKGPMVAIDETLSSGTPSSFHGRSGSFDILPADPNAPGFYKWGKLLYQGEHYLKFLGGPYFIKAGTNSPENFLGYAGFDNTSDHGGIPVPGLINGLHQYRPHIKDWGQTGLGDFSDPLFSSSETGIDSRGIIGALNYLKDRNINSLFILPMNLGGDGYETYPYVDYANTTFNKTHFDISKLRQWGEVLEHAGRKEILIQFVFNETEIPNERWLDNGTLGVERKLFYREIIARFGHLLAIKWNLCEENDFDTVLLESFASYIKSLDPYDHTIGFHTFPLPVSGDDDQWAAVLGKPNFSTNSIQAFPYLAGLAVEKWRADSAAMGRKWVVEFDEQTVGLTDDNAELLRKKMLYDVLFSGGHIEWYAGYNPLPLGGDVEVEDFGTRQEMWGYTWNARKFLERYTFYWLMSPMDGLVTGESSVEGGAEVLALPGVQYVIYFPAATSTGSLDLRGQSGTFKGTWYNPRSGEREGDRFKLAAGTKLILPKPPRDAGEDWVLHVGR